jgi:predicted glycogen debranching enzyme
VLIAGLSEWALLDGRRYPLSTHEFGDGTVDPQGYRHLEAFALDGMLPVWTYALEDILIERRVWMADGGNTTYVGYRLARGRRPVTLRVTPLATWRDAHELRAAGDGGRRPGVSAEGSGLTIRFPGSPPYRVSVAAGPGSRGADGRLTAAGTWWWNFLHREETARGWDDREDLYAPGEFVLPLSPGAPAALVATAEEDPDLDAARTLAEARARQALLVRRAGVEEAGPVVRQLTLAADQFIVRRAYRGGAGADRTGGPRNGKTILAGYHWFSDWGRDAMIALPGLALCTGRHDDAAEILRMFAAFVRDGLVPNYFPDHAGGEAAYNSADAALWFVLAAGAYADGGGEGGLAGELRAAVREVIDRHVSGTRHGIAMDPQDALLRAGEPGLQVTWMDAKVGDLVITPRIGKPVEINALWYNALRTAERMVAGREEETAARYDALAGRVRAAFRTRFVRPGRETLADVVDGPEGDDLTVRPNQIFAVSLPFPLIDESDAAAVVRAVGRTLLTTYGLRSLAPDAGGYVGTYEGDVLRRDRAYHEGTAWAWLIGPYAEAYHRVTGDAAGALGFLRPFEQHLRDAGLGTISEIFDGDPPHRPRGCIAQAWSVAEVLRVWLKLRRAGAAAEPPPR